MIVYRNAFQGERRSSSFSLQKHPVPALTQKDGVCWYRPFARNDNQSTLSDDAMLRTPQPSTLRYYQVMFVFSSENDVCTDSPSQRCSIWESCRTEGKW